MDDNDLAPKAQRAIQQGDQIGSDQPRLQQAFYQKATALAVLALVQRVESLECDLIEHLECLEGAIAQVSGAVEELKEDS